MGHRYYDPMIGRFISPDPIGLAGGPNLYAYCSGDPINFVDPDGLVGNFIVGGAVGVVSGYALAKMTGQEYGWKEGITDALLGASGIGLAKLGSSALKAARPAQALFFHADRGYDSAKVLASPTGLSFGRHWATPHSKLRGLAFNVGGRYKWNWSEWKYVRNPLNKGTAIPSDMAALYEPAFSLNVWSWWKGFLGQHVYCGAKGWRLGWLRASEAFPTGVTAWGVGRQIGNWWADRFGN